MAAKNKVELILTGDAKGATRAFKDVDGAAHGLSGKLSSLGSHLGKIATAFIGLAVIGKTADFLRDSAVAAAEDAKQQAILATTLGNVTGATKDSIAAVEEWITKQQFATGISDSQLRPALQNLVVATGSVREAQDLMGTAMDISVGKGIDLETVTKAMAKAHDGNAGALGRLGIATKDAEGKTLDFETIMKNANQTFGGDAATAADTTAGKMRILGERFGELKESLGEKLLPVFNGFLDWINTNMPTIQTVAETAFNIIGGAIKWVSEKVIGPLLTAFGDIYTWVEGNMDTIKATFVTAWTEMGNIIKPIYDTIVPELERVIGEFRDWFNGPEGSAKIVTAWNAIGTAADGVKAIVNDIVVPQMKDKIAELREWIDEHGAAIEETFGGVSTAAGLVAEIVRKNWPDISEVINRVLNGVWEPLDRFIDTMGAAFDTVGGVIDLIKGDWPNISEPIHAVWNRIMGPLVGMKNIFTEIAEKIQWALDKLNLWNSTPVSSKNVSGLNSSGTGVSFAYPGKTTVGSRTPSPRAAGGMVWKPSLIMAGEQGPERVLTTTQTALFERMVAALEGGRGGIASVTQYITGGNAEATGDAVVRKLMALSIA